MHSPDCIDGSIRPPSNHQQFWARIMEPGKLVRVPRVHRLADWSIAGLGTFEGVEMVVAVGDLAEVTLECRQVGRDAGFSNLSAIMHAFTSGSGYGD